MRYSDFKIRRFPKTLQDINGIKNYSLYLDLIEAEIIGKPLNESIDPQQMDSLERLKKLSSTDINVGDVCDYVFVMLDLNGRLHVLGNGKQVTLTKITKDEYRFSDGKTFPDRRWSKLSYSQLYIFSNNTNYEKFKTFLRLKFDVLVETTYTDFRLVEGYREVTQKFSQSADPATVKQVIDQFRDLVNRNQVQGNERNIDWWGKQGWDRFQKFVDAKSQQPSQTSQKKRAAQGRSHTIDETPEWLIIVPLDKDASCFHGKDTDWCTTKPTAGYFEQYFRDNSITLIYFLQKQTARKWAIAVSDSGEAEFFDQQDQPLSQGDFDRQTRLNSQAYIDQVLPGTGIGRKASDTRAEMIREKEKLQTLIDQFGELDTRENDPQIETMLLKVKDLAQLREYLMYLTDRGNTKAELDQNMQNLIANIAPDRLYNIKNLTDKTVRTALKLDPNNIKYIENPSLEMVKYSVDQGGDWVFYNTIERISPEVIEWVLEQNPYVIHSYLSKEISPQALQIATKAFVEEENENLYRDLLKWFRSLKDSDNDRLMDEDYYEWIVDAWEGKDQDLVVAAVIHNIFLSRRIGRYRRWAMKNLVPRFPAAREFLSDLGIKLD